MITVVDEVTAELDAIKPQLPKDVTIAPFYDQSLLVRSGLTSVRDAILIGLVLSVLVLYGFLRKWGPTLVVAAVIPITVLVTFLVMTYFGLGFDLMTSASRRPYTPKSYRSYHRLVVCGVKSSPYSWDRNCLQDITKRFNQKGENNGQAWHTDVWRQPDDIFHRSRIDERSGLVDRGRSNICECQHWGRLLHRFAPARHIGRPMVFGVVARCPVRLASLAGTGRLFVGWPAFGLANY